MARKPRAGHLSGRQQAHLSYDFLFECIHRRREYTQEGALYQEARGSRGPREGSAAAAASRPREVQGGVSGLNIYETVWVYFYEIIV